MTYKLESPQQAGYPPIEVMVSAPSSLLNLPIDAGQLIQAEDKVWGTGEFVFARANGSIRQYGLCVLTPVWDSTNLTYTWNATEVPNTANLGRTLCVAQGAGAMSSGQYGWFMISGITPVNCSASVTADSTFGIAAAGQGGANSAGKQILNARVVTAATQAPTRVAVSGESGDTRINFTNTDGFIVGGYLSGTGVGASAVVTFIDPLGKYILASVANSASVAGQTVTCTYNNATVFYNVAHLNRPFAQGAIT